MKHSSLLQKFSSLVRSRPPRRILLADDHEGIRSVFADLLRAEGYEVETVADGERALFKLAFESFDLLITDWKMPHLDGVTLVKWLRATGNHTPVLLLTSSDVDAAEVASIRGELAAVLGKPTQSGHLLAAVQGALGWKSTELSTAALTLQPAHV